MAADPRVAHPSRRGGRDGFTLIEALTAFAIVAVLALVVQRGLVQARIGWAAVEERTAAERVARTLLAEPLSPATVEAGGRSGVSEGRRFELRLATLDLPLPAAPPAPAQRGAAAAQAPGAQPPEDQSSRWQPLRVTIEVATARGSPVAIETIRLARMERGG